MYIFLRYPITRNKYLAITLAKLGLVTALKLSPVGRVKNWMGDQPRISS